MPSFGSILELKTTLTLGFSIWGVQSFLAINGLLINGSKFCHNSRNIHAGRM
jgi:hypothetical protein